MKIANTTGNFINPNFDSSLLISIGAEANNAPFINNFTAIFMHGDLMHLISNMACLWFLFDISYQRIGIILTDISFLITGFISNFLTQILSPETVSVGASGAIFGITGILCVIELYYKIKRYNNALGYVFSFAVYNVLFTFISPQINVYAHLGGLATGIIIGIFYTLIIFILNLFRRKNY